MPALDGLRGIAAISVLLHHAYVGNSHGYLAVDFFFCLSGFVIALAYERKLQSELRVAKFMWWRILRVYPMLAAGSLLGVILWPSTWEVLGLPAPTTGELAWIFAAQFLLVPFVFSKEAFPINNVQWSILYELIANFLYALLIRILTDRILLGVLMVSGSYLIVRSVYVGQINFGHDTRFIDLALARAMFPFSLGVYFYRKREWLHPFIPSINFWWLAALILVPASLHNLGGEFARFEIVRQLGTAMVLYPVVVLLGMRATFTYRWPVYALGLLSFPLYAFHAPLTFYVMAELDLPYSSLTFKAVMLAVCAGLVVLSYFLGRYVDLPLNRLRRRFTS